ncbi:hypothetical protein KKC32_01350 [Patescibacteria group bacterium]|nr:hypothetical protein [Patescibacteria group bacterium]
MEMEVTRKIPLYMNIWNKIAVFVKMLAEEEDSGRKSMVLYAKLWDMTDALLKVEIPDDFKEKICAAIDYYFQKGVLINAGTKRHCVESEFVRVLLGIVKMKISPEPKKN